MWNATRGQTLSTASPQHSHQASLLPAAMPRSAADTLLPMAFTSPSPQPCGCPLSTSCCPRLPCPSPPHLPSPFSACSRWLPGPALILCPINASCHAYDLAPVPLPQFAVLLPSTDALCPGHVTPVCCPTITACRSPQLTLSPCAHHATSHCRYPAHATAMLWSH